LAIAWSALSISEPIRPRLESSWASRCWASTRSEPVEAPRVVAVESALEAVLGLDEPAEPAEPAVDRGPELTAPDAGPGPAAVVDGPDVAGPGDSPGFAVGTDVAGLPGVVGVAETLPVPAALAAGTDNEGVLDR
jgi:hypothetical protein